MYSGQHTHRHTATQTRTDGKPRSGNGSQNLCQTINFSLKSVDKPSRDNQDAEDDEKEMTQETFYYYALSHEDVFLLETLMMG